MRRFMIPALLFCLTSISMFGCGGDGGSSPLGESSANAGAAIVAIFSQGGAASPAKRLVVDSRTCSSIGEGPPRGHLQ